MTLKMKRKWLNYQSGLKRPAEKSVLKWTLKVTLKAKNNVFHHDTLSETKSIDLYPQVRQQWESSSLGYRKVLPGTCLFLMSTPIKAWKDHVNQRDFSVQIGTKRKEHVSYSPCRTLSLIWRTFLWVVNHINFHKLNQVCVATVSV